MVMGEAANGCGSGWGSYPEQALIDAPTIPTTATPTTREKVRERAARRGIKIWRILSLLPDKAQDMKHNMSQLSGYSAQLQRLAESYTPRSTHAVWLCSTGDD